MDFNTEALNNFILEKIDDFEKDNNADYRNGALTALYSVYDKFSAILKDYESSLSDIDESPGTDELVKGR